MSYHTFAIKLITVAIMCLWAADRLVNWRLRNLARIEGFDIADLKEKYPSEYYRVKHEERKKWARWVLKWWGIALPPFGLLWLFAASDGCGPGCAILAKVAFWPIAIPYDIAYFTPIEVCLLGVVAVFLDATLKRDGFVR